GFETLHILEGETVFGGIQQAPKWTFQGVREQRRTERVRLEKERQARQRAFGLRRRGEAIESGPNLFLDVGRDRNLFMIEQASDPISGPTPFGFVVDMDQRLKCQCSISP